MEKSFEFGFCSRINSFKSPPFFTLWCVFFAWAAYRFYCNPGNQSKNKLKSRGIWPQTVCMSVCVSVFVYIYNESARVVVLLLAGKLIENQMNSASETISDFDQFIIVFVVEVYVFERHTKKEKILKIIAKTFNMVLSIRLYLFQIFPFIPFSDFVHFTKCQTRIHHSKAQCIQPNCIGTTLKLFSNLIL